MLRPTVLCAATMALFASVVAVAEPRDLSPQLKELIDKLAVPGAAAAIVRNGELAGIGVAGVRQLGDAPLVERGDLLMIGSCGKSLTRLLVGRLIDRGLLQPEATLAELMPDVPMRDEYKTVSVSDLLAHRGGIQPYTEIGPRITPQLFDQPGTPTEQRAAFVKHLLNEPPTAKPGTRFVYSNAGFGLLGHLVERVCKKPFEEAMRELVFEPLGMRSAIVGLPNSASGRVGLVGHMRQGDTYEPMKEAWRPPGPLAPAGMMSVSIDDFARFAAVLAACQSGKGSDFLTPATAERIRETQPGGEGAAFFGGDGFYAAVALWPGSGIAIVVGTNAGENDRACEAIIRMVRETCAPELTDGAAGGPAAGGPNRPRYGFGIRAEASEDGDVLTIESVENGSVAERAGLKVGDRLVVINGEAIGSLPVEKLSEQLQKPELKLTVEREDKHIDIAMKRGT